MCSSVGGLGRRIKEFRAATPIDAMAKLKQLLTQEREDEDFDLMAAAGAYGRAIGYAKLQEEVMGILADEGQAGDWQQAAAVLYWSLSWAERKPLEPMKIVARLYWCLERDFGLGADDTSDIDNLVWSIAKELKGVSYGSEWDPYQDPEVRAYRSDMG